MTQPNPNAEPYALSRRRFLQKSLAGGAVAAAGVGLFKSRPWPSPTAETFIARASSYDADLADIIVHGMNALGVSQRPRSRSSIIKVAGGLIRTPGVGHIRCSAAPGDSAHHKTA